VLRPELAVVADADCYAALKAELAGTGIELAADAIFRRGLADLLGWQVDLGTLPGRIVFAFAWAWLAAGLLSVSAVGLPAVYVPLPIGNGEQRLNSLPVVNAGGGLLVADADLTPEFVGDTVAGVLDDGPRLTAMTAAAAMAGHRDAAEDVREDRDQVVCRNALADGAGA
jgi:hypothetical protein